MPREDTYLRLLNLTSGTLTLFGQALLAGKTHRVRLPLHLPEHGTWSELKELILNREVVPNFGGGPDLAERLLQLALELLQPRAGGRVQTSTATPALIASFKPEAGTSGLLEFKAVGRRVSDGAQSTYLNWFPYRRQGALTEIRSAVLSGTYEDEAATTYSLSVDVDNLTILAKVQGINAEAWNWKAQLRTLEV